MPKTMKASKHSKSKKYPKKPKSPKRIKVVIDRSKWRTGGGDTLEDNMTGKGEYTALRNEQGYKCCLGFICQAAGFKGITGKSTPEDLRGVIPELTDETCRDTKLTNKAVEINDAVSTTPQAKEFRLKELFKNSLYSLVFKGKYTIPK